MTRRVVLHPGSSIFQLARATELEFAPVAQAPVLEFPMEREAEFSDLSFPAPGCLKAIRNALAIETAAALTIYGLWHLLHALR
ncbi:MAG: hypothetical protein WCC26_18560 [Terracidiphilus sp.]